MKNPLYEAIRFITEYNNAELNVDEDILIELVTGFNETLYGDDKEYERLVKDGSREFEFVGKQIPNDIKPVYIKINNGIIYSVRLSEKGSVLETKTSIEMKLLENQQLMRRSKINPELIGLYTRRRFREVMNFLDDGQFRKIA